MKRRPDTDRTSVRVTLSELPPALAKPQVTTESSDFKAANAAAEAETLTTPLVNLLATAAALESPPAAELPQVTTAPELFIAAKAVSVDEIEKTSVKLVETELESPPAAESPHVKIEPSLLIAANAADVVDIYVTCVRVSVSELVSAAILQVTTVPSSFSAAKAVLVEEIDIT